MFTEYDISGTRSTTPKGVLSAAKAVLGLLIGRLISLDNREIISLLADRFQERFEKEFVLWKSMEDYSCAESRYMRNKLKITKDTTKLLMIFYRKKVWHLIVEVVKGEGR